MGLLRFGVGPVAAGDSRRNDRAQAERALTRTIGSSTVVVPASSYAELLDKLVKSEIDLGWLPPALCVRAIDRGVTLLLGCVRAPFSAKLYHGAIFVPSGSSRKQPSDLRGARIAWVDPDSCSGYLFPRLALGEECGLDPGTLFAEERMLGSHEAVVRAVASGEVDCGATYVDTMADGTTRAGWMRGVAADAMRAIVTSAPIPSDAVCASNAMPRAQRDQVSAALAELHRSPEGAATLENLFEVARLEPALPRHYDLVRRAMLGTGAAISSTRFR